MNGEIAEDQLIRVTIGVDLRDNVSVGTKINVSAVDWYRTTLKVVPNARMLISNSVYWFMHKTWSGFFIYAGEGDPPPDPWTNI